ncbi:4'-phosphopantetheinyl transferase family protein [Streptomyces sp. BI20]|uniref:4'-phosphopantetheinyl transferase family protein n=1 Tax=Streptomyces sp. BI20 TaxID=3403460 RepID=UPI003C7869EC
MISPAAVEPLGPAPLSPRALPADGAPEFWVLDAARAEEIGGLPAADGPALLFDAEERARAARFVHEGDRIRYRASHVGLRVLLGAYLDLPPAHVVFDRAPCPSCALPHGRPVLGAAHAKAGAHPLHFSLSHSGDLALFGFASAPIGVDVERHPSPGSAADVAGQLHPRERAELAVLSTPAGHTEAVARCWARKEAYLKGVGVGVALGTEEPYVGAGPAPSAPAGWLLRDLPTEPGHAAAYALALTPSGASGAAHTSGVPRA